MTTTTLERITPTTDLAERVEAVATWDDNIALARDLASIGTACQWSLGDLAVKAITSGDSETLRAWAEEVGVSYAYARQMHMTAKAWPTATRVTGTSWAAHRTLAADPDRHDKLAALPTGTTAREARDVLVRAGRLQPSDDQTAEEQLAGTVEARKLANDSANARPGHAVKQHGADQSNAAEMAAALHQEQEERAIRPDPPAPAKQVDLPNGDTLITPAPVAAIPATDRRPSVLNVRLLIADAEDILHQIGAITAQEADDLRYAILKLDDTVSAAELGEAA